MTKAEFRLITPGIKEGFIKAIEKPVDFFIRRNFHPNFFTILGLILSAVGAFFYAESNLRLGGLFILLGGISDTFDGKIARTRGIASKFGAVLDSSLDRYAEFFMFAGLIMYFSSQDTPMHQWTLLVAYLALMGSIMVSYVRARAEGLGLEGKVGMMQRAERIVLIGLSSLINEYALIGVIWIVAIFANITAMQRIHSVWKEEKQEKKNLQ
jgi:CDP-diacylglycerol--glycerol-3-phosphate 3-phosphatidyltransferase